MPCTKTGRYPTLKKCREAIRFMRGKGYDKLIPYYCNDCHVWHVSSEQHIKHKKKKNLNKKWKRKEYTSRA